MFRAENKAHDQTAPPPLDSSAPHSPRVPVEVNSDLPARENLFGRAISETPTRHNPPVTIEDWPDPDEDTFDFQYDGLQVPPEDVTRDPDDLYACEHRQDDDSEASQQFAEMTDPELLDFLRRELGDGLDEEIQAIYKQAITTEDTRVIKILASKLRAHFSRQTYEDIRSSFAKEIGLPSEYIAWRRIQSLSGLRSRLYSCCINSCCVFLGKYRDLQQCPFCKEARFSPSGKPRKYFRYIPLIPQLQALYQNLSLIDKLRYRAAFQHIHGVVRDVFDGIHYRLLCRKRLDPDQPYCFFSDPHDLALGLSLDGFSMFKRRRKGNSTAWPLIIVNYNLPPSIRTHLENVICVGVIPGPKQFKDLNSFLIPLLEELLELESGVETVDCSAADPANRRFTLRAFLIIAFGDIPALSKLLGVKGHNALCPCRTCDIWGIQDDRPNSHVYYVPMTHPNGEYWDPSNLPMRTATSFNERIAEMEAAPTKTARNDLAREYGINSRCLLSVLRTIDMASSFPYDFMHLIYENLVPNLIRHWTGTFKNLDQGTGNYELSAAQWETIGAETMAATKNLPADFVGTLPDIAQDITLYKAEGYSFWIQYLAPILLKARLPDKYYFHLLNLRDIIELSLQFEITNTEIATLEQLIIRWVADYEAYYYQYDPSRVSACPLTLHALLHIPFYIRQSGPVWTSWSFVMERFCGTLLPAIKNRLNPYPCIDNYILRRAQMQIISALYDLPTIHSPARVAASQNARITPAGVQISNWEYVYDKFPASILNRPVHRSFPVDTTLCNQLMKYFRLVLKPLRTPSQIKAIIDFDSVIRYGRVRIAGGGDRIRTSEGDHSRRNNSFIRYILFPDANANFRNRDDCPIYQVNYGRIDDIFYVKLREHGDSDADTEFLLARVTPCDVSDNEDATEEQVTYSKMATQQVVIHLNSVEAAVGRVKRHTSWCIVDRSRGAVRTLFTADQNAPGEVDE